jgi:tol-pal system protein YbgF
LPPAAAAPPTPGTGSFTTQSSSLSPEELYRTALGDYTRGNYDLAITGFRDYVRNYPGTSQAGNSQYWLAESYFSQRNYHQAVQEFGVVLRDFGDSPKVPSALFKQGEAYLQLSDSGRASAAFCELVAKYPKTREAQLARERNPRCR